MYPLGFTRVGVEQEPDQPLEMRLLIVVLGEMAAVRTELVPAS
jgi:hypothetical protein